MRSVKCQKVLAFATVESHLWNGTEGNVIWFLLFLIHLSLSSQIKYLFLSSLWVTHSLLHPLHSHRLFCSLLFHFALLSFHSWATTNFLSTITQIPSSLIYKISFTDFFFPYFFALSSLFYLLHWSYLVRFSSSQSKALQFRLASQLIGFVFRCRKFADGIADSISILSINHWGNGFFLSCGGFDCGCLCGGFGVFDGGLWGDERWWLVR